MSFPIIESLEARIAPATLTISGPAQVDEGNSGTTSIAYTITLSEPAPADGVTVHFATEDGTATAGTDYVPLGVVVPFLEGETSHVVEVQVNGNTQAEPDKSFSVHLSEAVGATIGVDHVATTIRNDDSLLRIDSPTILEGLSGNTLMVFNVTLANGAADSTVTVNFATADKTAVAGSDYDAVSGTLQFLPGETVKQISVNVHGDTVQEVDEMFSLSLSNPSNATIATGQGTGNGTIRNDDPVINPIPSIVASTGQTGAKIDLGNLFDPSAAAASGYHTFVEFTTNFIDPNAPGVPQKIVLELFDDQAPLTVQNFLSYVANKSAAGDYDGVFFHRVIPGFVLQGGGYEASHPAEHITTGPLLHNEFATAWAGYADSATDDLRVNVRGTIATAKLGFDPNTASSEFFFNLADNSANLDFQNGGFTVFGKLTDSSMHVVDAISALMSKNLSDVTGNTALTDVPLQNYTSGAPTPDQLIQITGAKILTPHDGVSSGYTFSVLGISDAATGQPSKLVSAKLAGDTLDLKFKPGASGVAKIQVLATPADGSEPIPQEFLVTVKPNLIASSGGTTLSNVVVPGDTGVAKVKITNSGASLAKGKVDVKFYLSHVDDFDQFGQPAGADPYGLLLNDGDMQIGAITGKMISVASGKTTTLATKVQLPPGLAIQQGENYRVIAVVTTPDGSTISELFTDDNTTLDGTVHQQFNAFGTFKVGDTLRKNVPLTFNDTSGHPVTFKLSGANGYGQVFLDANGSIDVQLNGTTAKSVFSAQTAKDAGHFALRDITVADPIGTVSLGNTDLSGDFIAYGGLKSLTLGDAAAGDGTGHYIGIGKSDALAKAKPVVRLGAMNDTAFESLLPIGSLAATDWSNTNDAHEQIVVPALGSLAVKGRLTADVFVSTDTVVKSFNVGLGMENANVRILGSVGKVFLGSMTDSSFFAGDNGQGQSVGTSVIGSFIVNDTGAASGVLSNSLVVAPQFGIVYVETVEPNSGTEEFGFVSHPIRHSQGVRSRIANIIVNSSVTANNVYDAEGNYSVRLM